MDEKRARVIHDQYWEFGGIRGKAGRKQTVV